MNYKKTITTIIAVLLVFICNNGQYRRTIDPSIEPMMLASMGYEPSMPAPANGIEADSLLEMEEDSLMADIQEDIPMKVARMLASELILSTDGNPLDEEEIRAEIEKEAARRADSNYVAPYCAESMAYFNIVDDWAQIICFKRKDDSYLVFLIQYYDWQEGYGIIDSKYYILNNDVLTPTANPLLKFQYIADNKDTIGLRYDFSILKNAYDPKRLKLNTASQSIEHGIVEETINAEFMWTGRDFIELASNYTMPPYNDVVKSWKNAMPDDADFPSQYARIDIDSDGNDEYIFSVNDGSFNKFAIYTFINDKLSLIAGNYDGPRDIKMYHGGYVMINDNRNQTSKVRHIRLMGSEFAGMYIFDEENSLYTFKAERNIEPMEVSMGEYEKAIRRARKEISINDLEWRYWDIPVAK